MPAALAEKTVLLNGKSRVVRGLGETDPYFASIADGFEEDFAQFCARYVDEDDVCLDVGANIGMTATILSDFCPRGKVVAIEPNGAVFAALEQNIVANDLSNVKAVRSAIGDRIGTTRFNEQSAYGHIAASGTEVPITTLPALAAQLALSRIDFVKIDAEGYEPFILRGALDLLKEHRALVYIEFNTWCLITLSRSIPVVFLEWIFDSFEYVFVIRHSDPALMQRLRRDDILTFLHGNMLTTTDDLVLTNDLARVERRGADLERRFVSVQEARDALRAQYERAVGELDQVRGERDSAISERDHVTTQLDSMRNSSSWKITAPLRRLKTLFTS